MTGIENPQMQPINEQNVALLQQSALGIVEGALRPDLLDLDVAGGGEINGILWHRQERLGKQQPVVIIGLTFPDSSRLPVVLRPTSGDFKSYYDDYPEIKQYYPDIYAAFSSGQEDEYKERTDLVLEMIDGFHGDSRDSAIVAGFKEILATTEGFEQLCRDIFEAVDTIHKLPLAVVDISPAQGHNVIYNIAKKRFQFFDVDTLRGSNKSHVAKFLSFVDRTISTFNNSEQQLAFTARMVQMYQNIYPNTELAYESGPKELVAYSLGQESEDTIVLEPTNPEYEVAFYAMARQLGVNAIRQSFNFVNAVSVKRVTKKGRDTIIIDPDMQAAALANDTEAMAKILVATKNRTSRLLITEFVEDI